MTDRDVWCVGKSFARAGEERNSCIAPRSTGSRCKTSDTWQPEEPGSGRSGEGRYMTRVFLKVISCPVCGHKSAPGQENWLVNERETADWEVRARDPKATSAMIQHRRYQCWNCSSHIKTQERYEPEPRRAWVGRQAEEVAGPFVPLTPKPEGAILEQRRCVDASGKPLYEDPAYGRPCPCSDKPCECADPASRRITLNG